jgi:hypothetical protein
MSSWPRVQTITFDAGHVPVAWREPDGPEHSCTDDNSMGDAGAQNKPHRRVIHVGADRDAAPPAHP